MPGFSKFRTKFSDLDGAVGIVTKMYFFHRNSMAFLHKIFPTMVANVNRVFFVFHCNVWDFNKFKCNFLNDFFILLIIILTYIYIIKNNKTLICSFFVTQNKNFVQCLFNHTVLWNMLTKKKKISILLVLINQLYSGCSPISILTQRCMCITCTFTFLAVHEEMNTKSTRFVHFACVTCA